MNVLAIVLEALLGLAFVMAGIMKIAGVQMHVDNFNRWKLPQWFRPITGIVELAGGAAMLAGIWVKGLPALAGILLGITMLVGVLVHVRIRDTAKNTVPAVVLLILAVVVLLIQGPDLDQLFG
ncbi:DoxX family protein [Cohnella candidum]|uniref:DoxX family protein n=1 Tax=Cohnella candidum TaxID=2674991 RepID=A0A3G3JW99_9BACL|nr:DoxX family protein [Cohnella candidum]AYQ72121.1 DoxX family protein [Cohnella candidum]